MASEIEELSPVTTGKGCLLRTFIDRPTTFHLINKMATTTRLTRGQSKPEDSPEYSWIEASYDGKGDSELVSIPNHWYKDHDEIIEVLEGRMTFYLDGKELVVPAGDAPLFIARGHVHGLTAIKGDRMRFSELTKPAGDFKALFIQDFFQSGMPGFLMVMRVFYDGDTYASLPGGFKVLDYLIITIIGFIAKAFVPGKPASLNRVQ